MLESEKHWGPDDPLFPATKVTLGPSGGFEKGGLDRKHWKNAAAIRKIFKAAFEQAGLPYLNPHSFRNTLARWRTNLHFAGRVQGMEPELRPRACGDDVHELRRRSRSSPSANLRSASCATGSSASPDTDELDDETIAKVMALLTRRAA